MELPRSVCEWLLQCQLPLHTPLVEHHSAYLHEEDAILFENGVKLGTLLRILGLSDREELSALTDAHTTANKLTNWNLLITALGHFGIDVDADSKALIVAGDRDCIAAILIQLYERDSAENRPEPGGVKKKKRVNVNGAILINNIDLSADLRQSGSPLEFLILSLCQTFQLTPKQSAGLLTQGGKYLETLISRGMKGNFAPVLGWYKCILDHVKHLAKLILKDLDSASLALTMNSLKVGLMSQDASVWKASCLTLVALRSQLPGVEEDVWEWFLSAEIFGLALAAYQRARDELAESLVLLLYEFSKDRLVETFGEMLWDACPSLKVYFSTASAVVRHLSPEGLDALLTQGVMLHWVTQAVRECEETGERDIRLGALFIMCEFWEKYPESIEAHEKLANSILTELKKGVREGSALFKLTVLGRMFEFLAVLSQRQSSYLPILYKTLAFTVAEQFKAEPVREFIFTNVVYLLEQVETVPIDVLVDAALKQFQALNIGLNTFDFDFLIACARQPNLGLKQGILLMDTLGKIIVNEPRFARAAEIPFMILAGKFIDVPATQELITRFLGTAFKMFLTQHYPKRLGYGLDYTEEDQGSRALRNSLFGLTEKLLKLGNETMTDTLKELLMLINSEAKSISGQPLNGAVYLLEQMGQPMQSRLTQLELDYTTDKESMVSKTRGFSVISTTRALSDIERIAQQRKMRENHQRSISEQQKYTEQKQKQALERQIQARRVELGVSGRDDATVVLRNKPKTDTNLLFNSGEESEHEQDLLYYMTKRYARATRLMFTTYAKIGRKTDRVTKEDFEAAKQNQEQLLEGPAIKMLRDQHVTRDFISTEKLKQIYKQLTQKFKVTVMDFDIFQSYLYNVALHCFAGGSSRDLSRYPSAIALKALFEHCSLAGVIPKTVFDDPDPGAADREVVQRLNEQLLTNPGMPLPFGFKKVRDSLITVKFEVPEVVEAPVSFKVALTLLDDLLFEQFQFHILDPTVEVEEVVRAKGVLNRPEVVPEGPGNGVPAHKGAYKVLPLPAYLSLTPAIKLGISQMNGQYPNELLLDIARLTDDLLHTVNSHSQALISRNPKPAKQIDNAAKIQKSQQEAHLRAREEHFEYKRKKRMEELKQELARLQSEKEQQLRKEEQRLRGVETKQQQIQAYKQQLLEKARADKKRQVDAYRQQKEAEKLRQRAEAEERNKSQANPEFLKKAKRKLRLLYKTKAEVRKKEQEELEMKQKEAAVRHSALEKSLHSKLAAAKKQQQATVSFKQELQQAWTDSAVSSVLQRYSGSLQVLFDTYARQFFNGSGTLQMSLKALNKFLTQFNIIPSLLTTEAMERIYYSLTKSKVNVPEAQLGLSFAELQQACLRMSLQYSRTLEADLDIVFETSADKLAGLLEWMALPSDPREARNFLKKLDVQATTNPRDKKKQRNNLLRQLTNTLSA